MISSLIDFYLFSFLPTDPTSFLWCSVEQEINLVWPYYLGKRLCNHVIHKKLVRLT